MGGVDYAVHDVSIAAARNVVEASAQGPVVVEEMEFLFELHIQGEVVGEAFGTRLSNEFMLIVQKAKWKSGAGFHRVRDSNLWNMGRLKKGRYPQERKRLGVSHG